MSPSPSNLTMPESAATAKILNPISRTQVTQDLSENVILTTSMTSTIGPSFQVYGRFSTELPAVLLNLQPSLVLVLILTVLVWFPALVPVRPI